MRSTVKPISMLAVIAAMSLLFFALQLSAKVTSSTFTTAYASTNVTENSGTGDVPNLVSTPPPLLPSIEQTGDADANRTNTTQVKPPTGNYTNATALVTEGPRQIIQSKPTGNYTNATALVTEGPRQIITGRPAMGQVAPQNQPGLNTPNAIPGSNVISIPNINITKEQAAKADQEANVMIEVYYEKVKQEEELKARQQAAALAAAAQVNQTINNASQAEGSLEDNATASTIETEDGTDVEAEGEDEPEDEENDNENGGNEEEEEDSE
jgi:hypothetical protein